MRKLMGKKLGLLKEIAEGGKKNLMKSKKENKKKKTQTKK